MQATTLEERIIKSIAPSLTAMGYALVRLKLRDSGRKRVLEVMAERNDEKPMSVEDCVNITDAVSPKLDVENLISGAYDLEVSSPGVDRPLGTVGDFARFTGRSARVETMLPINGQRRFKGVIKQVEGENIILVLEDGSTQIIASSGIRSAKLVPEQPHFSKKPTSKKPTKESA